MADDPYCARPEVHELDEWSRPERPSKEELRLQGRFLAVLVASAGGFILTGVSFAHGCLKGSRWIEGAAPLVGGFVCTLAVLCVRRTWMGLCLAAGLLAVICWLLAPWYMAWAHGRVGCVP